MIPITVKRRRITKRGQLDALYADVALNIARLPRDQHAAELGRLVAAFERYGVAVPEQWRCDLEEA